MNISGANNNFKFICKSIMFPALPGPGFIGGIYAVVVTRMAEIRPST